MDFNHAAIWIDDLDATTAFYEDALGLDYQQQFVLDDVLNYYVGSPDGGSLQFKYDPDGSGIPDPAGIDHLAFSVDDVDATFERVVEETDCEVVIEPTTVDVAQRRVAFVTDPDGYLVEFIQPA